jgi:ArsR family transcriptional regulator
MPLREKVLADAAELLAALGHPSRLRILALLHEGERDVSDLKERLGIPPANASQHLAVLRGHHLVRVRREGTRMYYSLRDPRVVDLINRTLDLLEEDIAQAGQIRRAIERVRIRPAGS